MDILNLLLKSGLGDNTINQMAQKSGLSSDDVSSVISKIAPIFMQKANENFKSDADSSGLIDIITHTNLQNNELDVKRGNELLGFLTGSKDNSRALANEVGSSLGLDANAIKSLLPMIAPLVAGLLNRQVSSSSASNSNDLMSVMISFLDKNKDGSIIDDVLKIAGNFFTKRS
ncbi:hypothetical protein LMG7974_01549 [Campylobacter majalis]|uniref:DUF937 domain-containing protein n=1 Tax=Campylobacter majalis TaxID=2790656 RepID=A0ABM8Q9E4_9BACT|nr:DUF937 domain-containing protein [Campylobacter majalis]CAD7289477.1 hypothetical protein LMG7974_01549 [Campylobacter majalis]